MLVNHSSSNLSVIMMWLSSLKDGTTNKINHKNRRPLDQTVTGLLSCFLQEITLTEGSRTFETWKSPPPPVFMQYFFFNLTNADEFLAGAKPVVQQIGPYTYRYY